MKGSHMHAAKDALILFLKSLPLKCKFTILSFGNEAYFNKIHTKTVADMNEDNLVAAISTVKRFEANLGSKKGRNILKPLQMIFDPSNSLNFENKTKRIFILTDGDVEAKN